MKAVWSGDIGFGLVNIPVKLFSATRSSELDLDMVEKRSHARIHYQRVSENTGKEVPWENIVKAYDLNGRYVTLSDEDFKQALPEKTSRIDITSFVDLKEIDAIYFENPYYVAPAKSGSVPYALLTEALAQTGKAGLGTYVLRNKEHLCILRAVDRYILLQQIRFQEEIRDTDELPLPAKSRIDPGQLKIAISLIRQMSAEFDISRYKDTYSASLLKLIKAKAKGKKSPVARMKVVPKASGDLLSQLKKSLQAGKKTKAS
jgi:DNA end-binding protein Ku